MHALYWISLYCILIMASSLAGGWLPSLVRLTHTRMQLVISFVGGLMLGVSLFHLLPHGMILTNSLDQAMWWMVVGLLTMFFLIRVFHFHQHDTVLDHEGHTHGGSCADHDSHDIGRETSAPSAEVSRQRGHLMNWAGIAMGLAIHTIIDGIALGAAVLSEAHAGAVLPGLSIFVVVLMHKPLDALSITSLMVSGGWSVKARQVVNAAFAAMCPLGALLFALGVGDHQEQLIGCALAFSAGVFVCISLGDLLPELHFHAHDRLKLSAALLLGIATAYMVGKLEPHGHEPPWHGGAASGHVHDAHDVHDAP